MSLTPPADPSAVPIVADVWWAQLSAARPGLATLLTDSELRRRAGYRFAEDADRFLLGAALARLAAATRLGLTAAQLTVDRSCARCGQPHGRVRLPGTGLHVSVTHSGSVVGVAVCADARVGLDVEHLQTGLDYAPLAADVLAPSELAAWQQLAPGCQPRAFLRYWTRKEAAVKATGDGLPAGLANVVVTAPDQPAAVLDWHGRPELAHALQLADLTGTWPACPAALAALATAPVQVAEHDAADLLGRQIVVT
jgi:4'-phosphopantetheinyl transferase